MAALSALRWAVLDKVSTMTQSVRRPSAIRGPPVICVASSERGHGEWRYAASQNLPSAISRREAMGLCGFTAALLVLPERLDANAAALPEVEKPKLCGPDCEKDLEKIPTQTTSSGLQFKDIVVGKGPKPPKGFQVAANYVAMIPTGKVFDSSLDKGLPYIFRVGAAQVIKGLDEGIMSMKVGGKRRLYIPGELAFPKGLDAAAGRPRVAPNSPVVFDVDLLYVPGLEDEEIEGETPVLSSAVS